MSLAPLLDASFAIQLHAVAALLALALGITQLAGPKGTTLHRAIDYTWAAAMLVIAASSFWIHEIRQWHGFSLIHLLSIWVLVSVPMAVAAARRGRISKHRVAMISLFFSPWSWPACSRCCPAASCTPCCSAAEAGRPVP